MEMLRLLLVAIFAFADVATAAPQASTGAALVTLESTFTPPVATATNTVHVTARSVSTLTIPITTVVVPSGEVSACASECISEPSATEAAPSAPPDDYKSYYFGLQALNRFDIETIPENTTSADGLWLKLGETKELASPNIKNYSYYYYPLVIGPYGTGTDVGFHSSVPFKSLGRLQHVDKTFKSSAEYTLELRFLVLARFDSGAIYYRPIFLDTTIYRPDLLPDDGFLDWDFFFDENWNLETPSNLNSSRHGVGFVAYNWYSCSNLQSTGTGTTSSGDFPELVFTDAVTDIGHGPSNGCLKLNITANSFYRELPRPSPPTRKLYKVKRMFVAARSIFERVGLLSNRKV